MKGARKYIDPLMCFYQDLGLCQIAGGCYYKDRILYDLCYSTHGRVLNIYIVFDEDEMNKKGPTGLSHLKVYGEKMPFFGENPYCGWLVRGKWVKPIKKTLKMAMRLQSYEQQAEYRKIKQREVQEKKIRELKIKKARRIFKQER